MGRAQLIERGVSGSAIDRALCSGTLHRLYPGVYSVVAPELLGQDGRLIAAPTAAGSGALLSHGTAAWRWQIAPAPPTMIELSVPHRRAPAQGRALHRRAVLPPSDVTWNGRFPSTSVGRTLLDLVPTSRRRAPEHHDRRRPIASRSDAATILAAKVDGIALSWAVRCAHGPWG